MDKRKSGIEFPGVTICLFCHDGAKNVFLNKRGTNCRDEHGRWDLCGGAIDFGETIEETVRKELAEEYCATPLEVEFLGARDIMRKNDEGVPTHWIGIDFAVRIDPAVATNGEPHKFDEVRWFAISDLPKSPAPLHSQFPLFFERYRAKLSML
ncbi:MAG: NUDIX hydrolase [Candidatus Paceibacterota bacterium]|jgi:ADP-ribose pyrophosphatase YjhB (NUDIX family)